MLNGKYVSFYPNGVKKSEGSFQFNNRIGEWVVWDSTGKLRVKRLYTNPL
jgi:antitoxin component YwqK of YwqJK toxin-antitoxin module